jgi:hypothetical protein
MDDEVVVTDTRCPKCGRPLTWTTRDVRDAPAHPDCGFCLVLD